MSKSNWKFRWQRPSKFGWAIRLVILAICSFIWINSWRATVGGSFAWPEDPDVYAKKQMNPDPPIILFYWDRVCVNFNRSRMPIVHPGVPHRFAYYVRAGSDPNPTTPWQHFDSGFVAPTWAVSLLALAISMLLWCPRLIRIRAGFCPTCKYNLSGITSTACPECGTNRPAS